MERRGKTGSSEHSFRPYSPEELLGPLNDVERRNAPAKLFVAGKVEVLREGARVSVVGSRKASLDAFKRAAKLSQLLAEHGVIVVSGLAKGVNTAAHETAMLCGGRTIAVLGTPLNEVYPKENTELQQKIMREHLVISQFPPGHPVRRENFPQRNRTMALIADASVIVEAGESSGSLLQGWEALRLGRPLFIMKSVAEDPRLKWPAEMLHYGALVLSDGDVEALFDCLPIRTGDELASLAF